MRILSSSVHGSSRDVIARFLQLVLPLAVVCIASAVVLIRFEVDVEREKIRFSENASIRMGVNSIRNEVQAITNDLAYLAALGNITDLVSQENQTAHRHIRNEWETFSRIKGAYDQIRWLDNKGQERVRVNYNNGAPGHVPKDKLQNKGSRYYFIDAIKLAKGEFFISPLDLNMERGSIELPIKPMIRIATPVFDHDGNKQGIILLNYLGEKLLNKFEKAVNMSNSRGWLLNRDGYWLSGPTSEFEWGFMYSRPDLSLAHRFPGAWKRISAAERSQFEDEQGLWTFATIFPLLEGQKTSSGTSKAFAPSITEVESSSYVWKVVLLFPRDKYDAIIWQTSIAAIAATTALLAVLFIGCWLLASHGVRREKAEVHARTDALTGIHNRRSFFEYGKVMGDQAKRYGQEYTVIMLDIDWFKKINDTYGHSIGDEAIKVTATTISENLRSSDFAGRIGGDEFAILLPTNLPDNVLEFAERLRKSIEAIVIPVNNTNLTFTASLGIASCEKEDTSIENTLARADEALYQAKAQGRNRAVLF